MTLEDVNEAGELVIDRIASNARVSWGARVNSNKQGSMRATVVLAGVDSPFLVKDLKPFDVIMEKVKEINVTEKIEVNNQKKGFFGRLFKQ